jgi:starch synthase
VNILLVATEIAPFFRSGGLADVVRGFAKELNNLNVDARIVVPAYRTFAAPPPPLECVVNELQVELGTTKEQSGAAAAAYSRTARVLKAGGAPPIYFIEQDYYFGRDEIYGYPDDYERFIFFTLAALRMLQHTEFASRETDARGSSWFPEIVHGYDWATGLMPAWMRVLAAQDERFSPLRFVLTVHNIRRMGLFGSRALQLAQLTGGGIYPAVGEEDEQVNFLGRGILTADRVVMVDPVFDALEGAEAGSQPADRLDPAAAEPASTNPLPEPAQVLAQVIARRYAEGSLVKIRNGIDEDDYDPRHDKYIKQVFTSPAERGLNKRELQRLLGFEINDGIPLLGMSSRLIPVNGFDLLAALHQNRDLLGPIQLAILADTGMPEYRRQLTAWEREQDASAPWIKSRFQFDDTLARQIYAGADIFLLPPSEYPSGITQYQAMRYGAVPLVRSTGALSQSVLPYPGEPRSSVPDDAGIGFKFYRHDPAALLDALLEALAVYRDPDRSRWAKLQMFNMRRRFDWGEPVERYLELYRAALAVAPRELKVEAHSLNLGEQSRLLQAVLEIDNLPGLGARNPHEILRQAGRIIRGVLACDAVYVWDVAHAEDAEAIAPSLDRAARTAMPDKAEVAELLNHSAKTVWGQLADTDLAGICQPVVGLADSPLAQREGWVAGRSVPIWAHGHLLGRIDVLLTAVPATQEEDRWLTVALTTLAGSFGQRLHAIHEAQQEDALMAAAQTLLGANDFATVARHVVAIAMNATRATNGWLFFAREGELVKASGKEPLAGIDALAQRAFQSKQRLELADWLEAPREDDHRLCRSVLAVPLWEERRTGRPPVGVLVVAHRETAAFAHNHIESVEKLAPLAATALVAAAGLEARDQKRLQQLSTLSTSLTSSANMEDLLQKIVETTMGVLLAQAASLYLWDDQRQLLVIRAAAGYHTGLMSAPRPTYERGVGLTGWIFETGQVFKADSTQALHNEHWRGRYKDRQGDREPNAYLGIPLRVEGRTIGVLKLEDRISPPAPMTFSAEDQLLGEMMGNVIATVVYNAQRSADDSAEKLTQFSQKLGDLSTVLAASGDRRSLMDSIVEKIKDVVGVDAASLFLKDPSSRQLVLESASGYQAKLKNVHPRPYYGWGEGVTGWIAQQNEPFSAESLGVLRAKGKGKRGKYDTFQENKQPEFFYGLPLNVDGMTEPIGVLKIESEAPRPFTPEDRLLVNLMGNVIAAVVFNTQASERKLNRLTNGLKALSGVLAGGKGRRELMDNLVNMITDVVGVDAASLFLADEEGKHLVIQAASGYQVDLVNAQNKPQYDWGEGVTGRIAASKRPFSAASLTELRSNGGSERGKYDGLQCNNQPEAFYGVPLTIEGEEKANGVLKVERLARKPFTPEEVLLVDMLGNIIGAVVHNAELSDRKLAKLSSDIRTLAGVLSQTGVSTQDWFQQIVETLSKNFDTDAASLYLVDESNKRLVSVAASGYQRPLVKAKAYYELGEGVTGQIARTRKPVRAPTLRKLRDQGTSSRGKYDDLQGGHQPQSFYGVPVSAADDQEPIGVLKFESLQENYFSEEKCLLIDLMAGVIATVIVNSWQGEERIGGILQQLGSISSSTGAAAHILRQYAEAKDSVLVNQLARALALRLSTHTNHIESEAQYIFRARSRLDPDLRADLYERIASWGEHNGREPRPAGGEHTNDEQIFRQFGLYGAIWRWMYPSINRWDDLAAIAQPWIQLRASVNRPDEFAEIAGGLAAALADRAGFPHGRGKMDASNTWFCMNADAAPLFGDQVKEVTFLFQSQGRANPLNATELAELLPAATAFSTLLIVQWQASIPQKTQQQLRKALLQRQIGVVFLGWEDVFQLLEPKNTSDQFRSRVLHHAALTSPYVTRLPVRDKQFYGRDDEIKTLTQYSGERSFAVVGNRRIGKTSLLWCVAGLLRQKENMLPLTVNCMDVRSPADFFDRFSIENGIDLPVATAHGFADKMRMLRAGGRMPILLIDEVDRLLDNDFQVSQAAPNESSLVSTWRSLASDRTCSFIFFGSARLAQLLGNAAHDISNFPERMALGYFPKDVAGRLLIEPLERLSIAVLDKNRVIDRLFEFTSGHPALVQMLGTRLVDSPCVKEERYIDSRQVEIIGRSSDYCEEYLNIVWGEIGPHAEGVIRKSLALERIITLLDLEDKFRLSDLKTALARAGIEVASWEHAKAMEGTLSPMVDSKQILNALRILKQLAILGESEDGCYYYVPAVFPAFRKSYPPEALEDYIAEAIADLPRL